MRTIKINIDNKVFKKLEKLKKKSKLAWDKFIVNSILKKGDLLELKIKKLPNGKKKE